MVKDHTLMSTRSVRILFKDTLRPVYLAAVMLIGGLRFWDLPWPKDPGQLLSASLTVGSVVIGFLVSAKAIIVSSNSRNIEHLRSMDLMIELTDAFAVAIYLSMAFIVLNTIGFFDVTGRWFEAIWISIGVSMLYSFKRITTILFRLVRG